MKAIKTDLSTMIQALSFWKQNDIVTDKVQLILEKPVLF
jgi:hypothetical protein